jgi:2-polyprenyl-3-methyl-5-hydroxy-6-metoxy-1,4-benzoquinol methylase
MAVDAQTMAELETAERPCPLCGGLNSTVVGTRDRRGAALRTVLCADCGHVFTNPAPNQESLAAYYRDAYRQDYKSVAAPKHKHIYRAGVGALQRMARLAPHIASGAKIVDVGAGGGEFVYLLSKKGFDATGIEPHTGYADYARGTYGIDIRPGTLETVSFPAEHADAVTLHHVLEHTSDPTATLRQIWEWLKPDGIVVIEVPNLISWAHAPHHRFHRAHLHTFSRIGLEDALTNAGFLVEHINRPGDKNHLNVIARKFSRSETQTWRNVATENITALTAHTRLAHFFSGQPLRRIHANFTRPFRETLEIRALDSPKSGRPLLDRLFAKQD